MNTNFKLEFGNKNVLVRFSTDEKAHTHVVENPYDSRQFANALTAEMTGQYPIRDAGLFLHKSWDELAQSLGDKNCGYALGTKLAELVAAGRVVRNKDINPTSIYRILFDGFRFSAAELVYKPYAEDEPDFVKHDRNARNLIEKLQLLARAAERGWNVRLLYTENESKLFESLEEKYNLFEDGEIDELKEKVREGIENKRVFNTIRHMEVLSKRAAEAGKPFVAHVEFVVRDHEGNELQPESLIGSVIQFVRGNFTMTTLVTVNEDNLDSTLAALKKLNAKVFFVDCPANTIEHVEA